tara:strand:- start:686 stop:1081 length:396 start_codon:yes stop_codon:yes gene_type:complete
MSLDFELFPGKNLSGLFQDIYTNQTTKKKNISELIAEMRKTIRHAGDMAVVGPILKDLIDTSVRNDDQLIKLATIAQRIMLAGQKNDGDDGFLSAAEREQLLAEIEEVQEEVERIDSIQSDAEKLTHKIQK